MAAALQSAWDDANFVPQSLRIRHATHGNLTYGISKPAQWE